MPSNRITTLLTVVCLITGCAGHEVERAANPAPAAPVSVDLRVRDSSQSPYLPVTSFTVPANHTIGDGMFPYEGIGWENGFVGYRLYLDGRLTSDAFGKRQSTPSLDQIGPGSRYHELAPWGMDVLHVGPSLGLGGLGIIRQGQPRQFGAIDRIDVRIDDARSEAAAFTLTARGIKGENGAVGAITSRYSIDQTSPMTRVTVSSGGNLPLATGIVMHQDAEFWQSRENAGAKWRYIATFGLQSENEDNLGLALFYRKDQAAYGGLANETRFVTFNGPKFEYGFLAAWELDPGGVNSKAEFKALLQKELDRLETPARRMEK